MDFEQELARVAQQDRGEGYAVTLRPKSDQLPAFAWGFRVDILARRADGNVLVRVVRNRSDLEANGDVAHEAEATNQQPGWGYDFIVLHPDDPIRSATRAGEPSPEQIQHMLAEAELVVREARDPYLRAAFVLAWGTLEAVLRRFAHRCGISDQTSAQPVVLIRELHATGRISQADFRLLDQMRQVRMAVVGTVHEARVTSVQKRIEP
jgi:hypothetical protein